MTQTQRIQQQAPTTLNHQLPSGLHQEHSLPSSTNLPFNDIAETETYQREIVLGEISRPVPSPPEMAPKIEIQTPQIELRHPPNPVIRRHTGTKPIHSEPEYQQLNRHFDQLKARLVTVENIIRHQPQTKEHDNYWMVILLIFVASLLLMSCYKK
jgi:hypothetical protein